MRTSFTLLDVDFISIDLCRLKFCLRKHKFQEIKSLSNSVKLELFIVEPKVY